MYQTQSLSLESCEAERSSKLYKEWASVHLFPYATDYRVLASHTVLYQPGRCRSTTV